MKNINCLFLCFFSMFLYSNEYICCIDNTNKYIHPDYCHEETPGLINAIPKEVLLETSLSLPSIMSLTSTNRTFYKMRYDLLRNYSYKKEDIHYFISLVKNKRYLKEDSSLLPQMREYPNLKRLILPVIDYLDLYNRSKIKAQDRLLNVYDLIPISLREYKNSFSDNLDCNFYILNVDQDLLNYIIDHNLAKKIMFSKDAVNSFLRLNIDNSYNQSPNYEEIFDYYYTNEIIHTDDISNFLTSFHFADLEKEKKDNFLIFLNSKQLNLNNYRLAEKQKTWENRKKKCNQKVNETVSLCIELVGLTTAGITFAFLIGSLGLLTKRT